MPSGQTHEQRPAWVIPGLPMALGAIIVCAGSIALLTVGNWARIVGIILLVVFGFVAGGVLVVQPNESRVLILFGRYAGTITQAGLWWCNPFNKRRKVSLRVRQLPERPDQGQRRRGNPIEIAAVVVWRVTDTAKAMFDVVAMSNS